MRTTGAGFLQGRQRAVCSSRSLAKPCLRSSIVTAAAPTAVSAGRVNIADVGSFTAQGTSRKVNEDRYDVQVPISPSAAPGTPSAFVGVYDGHGGSAVAEWLKNKLLPIVQKTWGTGYNSSPQTFMTDAYLAADKKLLVSSGFLGMGERGVGGSKCGATGATIVIFQDTDGSSKLLTANVGDARILVIRDGQPVQLTEDHVPDSEKERKRIEAANPNPKQPLVRYIGNTWRVGGLLALSRAFGDAYLKGSLQFEGLSQSTDNAYSSGFGLTAEPYTTLTPLTDADSWIIVASDGLYAEEERGGGGGLDNTGVRDICMAAAKGAKASAVAETLGKTAVELGSTDDVTLVVLKLAPA